MLPAWEKVLGGTPREMEPGAHEDPPVAAQAALSSRDPEGLFASKLGFGTGEKGATGKIMSLH